MTEGLKGLGFDFGHPTAGQWIAAASIARMIIKNTRTNMGSKPP